MPNDKPATRKGKGAAAAVAALDADDEHVFEWRGVEFTRPARLPASLAFDIAEMQLENDLGSMFRFLVTFVGAEQVAKLRNKVAEDGDLLDDFSDVVEDFISTAMESSGVSLGE